jgi:peptide/nickel transport system permease protein
MVFKDLLRSPAGLAGAVILVLFSLISLYVLVTFPLDYGTRYWSNPKYWEDYPKLAPRLVQLLCDL